MTGRVLVVDDLDINIKLLEAKLSSEYFDVLTALSDAANRVRGLEAGADDFLTKPVVDVALFARVRSLVRLRRMMHEWRLRDEICGRLGGSETRAELDQGPARILIIDEDPLAGAKMTEALAGAHYVTSVANCADAQSCLNGDTDLVIASLTAPNIDTLRFVSQCRSNDLLRQLPILLVAAARDLPRLAKGLDLGANDYLVRPVDRNELLARTNTQIRRRRLQNRLNENYRRS